MLQAVSYLAPNWFRFYQAVTDYLSRSLGVEVQLQQGSYDPLEDPLISQDRVDLAFICGLPFIRYQQVNPHQLIVVAAPVMSAPRYHNQPVYYSDIVVHVDSSFNRISDLAETTFCYNDPGSNSGYNLIHWYLLQKEYPRHFFGKYLQSGSHERSLQFVVEKKADCAAIDSTVLEQALRDQPKLAQSLRTLKAVGPTPMPPVVAASHLGSTMLNQLRVLLLNPDQELRQVMTEFGVQQYTSQTEQSYEVLAMMFKSVACRNF